MGHNDRRRWKAVPDGGFERAASEGRTWRLRPLAGGWRLERVDFATLGWLGGGAGEFAHPLWDAATPDACRAIVAHIDRHEALAARMSEDSEAIERDSHLPGIRLKGRRRGLGIHVAAYRDGVEKDVGSYSARMSDWLPAWVLGEPTFDGGSSVDRELVGKGLGRALYDLAEELAGVPLTPHGRYGTTGGLTEEARTFWEKRAAHQRVPGVGDPAVAAREAERVRVRRILEMASLPNLARDPNLAAAMSAATGWDVVYVPDGEGRVREAWCLDPEGAAFSGAGPDDGVPSAPIGGGEAEPRDPVRTDSAAFAGMPGVDFREGPREAMALHASDALLRYAGIAVEPAEILSALRGLEAGPPAIPR